MQTAAEAVAFQLNVTKESALPACLIADVKLSFSNGRRLLQDDDDDSWDQGISSKLDVLLRYQHVVWLCPCSWLRKGLCKQNCRGLGEVYKAVQSPDASQPYKFRKAGNLGVEHQQLHTQQTHPVDFEQAALFPAAG